MLDNIKNEIYQNLNELFVSATLDEMAGDILEYEKKLKTISNIAEILNIDTEIFIVTINLKSTK